MTQTSRSLQSLHVQQFRRGVILLAACGLAAAAGCSRQSAEEALEFSRAATVKPARVVLPAERNQAAPDPARRLLRQAAAVLEQRASISAKMRHTIHLYGQEIAGVGSYLQMRNPEDGPAKVLCRLELQLTSGVYRPTWQQICDGRYIWSYRKLPDAGKPVDPRDPEKGYNKRLTRVDVEKIISAAGEPPEEEFGRAAWGLSGLPRLLQSLADAFEFEGVQSSQIGRVPVWLMAGRWRRPMLAELLPEQREAIERGEADLGLLPERAPDSVVVSLGQDDLFPFRIVYRRSLEGESGMEVVKMELYEVRFDAPLEPRQFDFQTKKKFHDETAQFLQSYRKR